MRAWRGWTALGDSKELQSHQSLCSWQGRGTEAGRAVQRWGIGGSSCVFQRTGLVLRKDSKLHRKTVLWAQPLCPVGLNGGSGNRKGKRSKCHMLGAKDRVGRPPVGPSSFLRVSSSLLPVCRWIPALTRPVPSVFILCLCLRCLRRRAHACVGRDLVLINCRGSSGGRRGLSGGPASQACCVALGQSWPLSRGP